MMSARDERGAAQPTARRFALGRLTSGPLSVQLAVLSGSITALVVFVGFWILNVETRTTARRVTAQELATSQRTQLELQRRTMDQLRLTTSLITQRPTVAYALSTYRLERNGTGASRRDLVATVARELQRVRGELDADLIAVTDEEGQVFAPPSVRDPHVAHALSIGASLASLPAVRRALDPTRSDGGLSIVRLDTVLFQVSVAPVVLDGFTLGTLVLGQRLDVQYLQTLRRSFDGEAVIAEGSTVIVSSLRSVEHAGGLFADSTPSAAHTVTVGEVDYVVAALPLGDTQSGSRVELLLLQPLTPALRAISAALLPKFVIYGTLAVVIGVIAALLLARAALKPLSAFVVYMRAGTAAEQLAAPFDASRAAKEIRVLNTSFEQLIASLSRQRGQLEQRTEQLSAANEVLSAEIRERERITRALGEREEQLRQSQKLEAIGTLAGGVAHDFNNMLTAISGFTELALTRVGLEHEAAEDLRQVIGASERAAALTHQLLAFGRKQVLQPRVLEVGGVIIGIEPMLRRLIGEHIDLRIDVGAQIARIKADPGQLEQVIVNLVVNARDAMPNGGTLTIAAAMATDPETRAPRVALRVSDTGMGMEPSVRDRIFEPFFTTKEPGKGTGLGLSTVYGIVRQSGGTIDVDSTPGRGTTFTIAFPPVAEMVVDESAFDHTEMPTGNETVLLVEDDQSVREFARRTLEGCGYTVLSAEDGVEAIALVNRTTAPIDALLTDIVMPRMNGPQLVERFTAAHGASSIIYMSGYADERIMRLEIDPGVSFLRKPFTQQALARVIRQALDRTRRATHAFTSSD